ncbi:MAG: ferrochelatase [Armatimonadetes bacterium]|nr:ferrochelatase [Armatimonadota bacterium]MBS1726664.1 ferrochelatase [Armatimonadota bacterium]
MSEQPSNLGLLVMHYGTPATIDDVLPYYTHIRRGRPPTQELLDDLVGRYQAIGGPSPLTEISQRQAELIQAGLRQFGVEAKLYVGTKHTTPFVAEAVQQMAADGIDHAVGVILAPHFSSFSVAAYRKYATEARDESRPTMGLEVLERWGTMPELIQALADRVKAAVGEWNLDETLVIFSAHSLPEKIMASGDPYKSELLETSQLVAEACGLPHWTFAFQSASQTGEPWLGPDILEVIEAEASGYRNIVACTVGFVSDHLEVLYDLGIEARDKCAEVGVNFRRAETLNADEKVMTGLAGLAAKLYPQ